VRVRAPRAYWCSEVITFLTGVPGVFGPYWKAFAEHLWRYAKDRLSSSWGEKIALSKLLGGMDPTARTSAIELLGCGEAERPNLRSSERVPQSLTRARKLSPLAHVTAVFAGVLLIMSTFRFDIMVFPSACTAQASRGLFRRASRSQRWYAMRNQWA
jgi:hypothetical protein